MAAPPHHTTLLSLPNELLYETAAYLGPKDVNAFMQANHRLYRLLNPILDRLLTDHADEVLAWAARFTKESFFELAIVRGANCHQLVQGSSKPPLYFAVTQGWDTSVNLLVQNGCRDFGSNPEGHTALHGAVFYRHLSTTQLLLDLGWDPSVPAHGALGIQPLHTAIFSATYDIIEVLVGAGANVNAKFADQTTVEIAVRCQAGGLKVIRMLLMNGFDTSTRDHSGARDLDNSFREAVKIGDEAVIKLLLETGANINCRSPVRYETPLHTAIRLEQWHILKFLLDSGVDVNARNREQETALFSAAIGREREDWSRKYFVFYEEDNHKDCVRPNLLAGFKPNDRLPVIQLLLDAGIDVNARDVNNFTVLFRAVCRGSAPIIKLLLHHGADIHAQNSDDEQTALHAAAGCGDESVVQLLLEHGSEVNSRIKNGSTALHVALQHGDAGTAKLLIEAGIDIDIRVKGLNHFDKNPYTTNGASAMYIAVRLGHEDVARQLVAKGAQVDVQYNLKANKGFVANKEMRTRMMTMFAEKGLNPVIFCEGNDCDELEDGSEGGQRNPTIWDP